MHTYIYTCIYTYVYTYTYITCTHYRAADIEARKKALATQMQAYADLQGEHTAHKMHMQNLEEELENSEARTKSLALETQAYADLQGEHAGRNSQKISAALVVYRSDGRALTL